MTKRMISYGRPAQVLLVDDNRGDALLAAHAFKSALFETNLMHASTGEIALGLLHDGASLPDLVLLDLQLPQMSGMDVLTAIKSDERLKHIPVIVLSNSGDGHNVTRCYQHHASAYVIKPLDLAKYRETIALIEQFFFVLASLPVIRLPKIYDPAQ